MMTARGHASKTGRLARLGLLRSLLMSAAILVIAAAPFADGGEHLYDWRLLPSVVAPSVMMMLVFAIPLDITMSRIFMTDADLAEINRLKFVIRTEAVVYLAMLLAWTPFIARVLDFSFFTGG
jgi:hypothetical protein